MNYCSKCGKPLGENGRFCPSCGTDNSDAESIISEDTAREAAPVKNSDEITAKKARKKKALIKVCICTAALTVVAACGYFALSWYTSPEQQALRAIAKNDYDAAAEILQENRTLDENEKLVQPLKERMESIRAGFMDGSIEYAAAKKELEDINALQISGTEKMYKETLAFVEKLNESRTNFSTAESLFARENYPEAMALYKLVVEDDANYETAKKQLTACTNNYRDKVLAEAAAYAENEAYSDAIALLNAALETLPNDSMLTEQIVLYQKDLSDKTTADTLAQAASCADKEDYWGAMSIIADTLQICGTNPELSRAYNEYYDSYVIAVLKEAENSAVNEDYASAILKLQAGLKNVAEEKKLQNKLTAYQGSYAEQVIGQSNALVDEKRFDDALSLITDALKIIPGNTALTEQKTAVESKKPKNLLTECPPYQTAGYYTEKTYSLTGDTYTNGFHLDDNYGGIAYFNLNKQYNTLSFDVGHIDGKNLKEGCYYFYLDGTLIYTLKLDPSMLVKHVEIPLNGAAQLVIEGGYWCHCFALVNIEIAK
ncbi:MAG: hypothetical protein ACI3V3_02375 [Faecousia sp.]